MGYSFGKTSGEYVLFKSPPKIFYNYSPLCGPNRSTRLSGPNYKTLLDFWWFIESLTVDKLEAVSDRYFEIEFITKESAYHRASDAANIITEYARDAAVCTHNYGKFRYAISFDVTYELIAMHIILDKGESLMFIPLFNDL